MPRKTDLIPTGSAQADINIFTVASGLLYEVSNNTCFARPFYEFLPYYSDSCRS
jgi:hypothetical protein